MKLQSKAVLLPAGLRLPENIGDVGDGITCLDLSDMGLIGKCTYPDMYCWNIIFNPSSKVIFLSP
jgi:hypothetical protein